MNKHSFANTSRKMHAVLDCITVFKTTAHGKNTATIRYLFPLFPKLLQQKKQTTKPRHIMINPLNKTHTIKFHLMQKGRNYSCSY